MLGANAADPELIVNGGNSSSSSPYCESNSSHVRDGDGILIEFGGYYRGEGMSYDYSGDASNNYGIRNEGNADISGSTFRTGGVAIEGSLSKPAVIRTEATGTTTLTDVDFIVDDDTSLIGVFIDNRGHVTANGIDITVAWRA